MATKAPYKKPKYKVTDIVILYIDASDTYVQAEVLQANTSLGGEWLYRVRSDIYDMPITDDKIEGKA